METLLIKLKELIPLIEKITITGDKPTEPPKMVQFDVVPVVKQPDPFAKKLLAEAKAISNKHQYARQTCLLTNIKVRLGASSINFIEDKDKDTFGHHMKGKDRQFWFYEWNDEHNRILCEEKCRHPVCNNKRGIAICEDCPVCSKFGKRLVPSQATRFAGLHVPIKMLGANGWFLSRADNKLILHREPFDSKL